MSKNKESYVDVGNQCSYLGSLLQNGAFSSARGHFEHCAQVYADDLRWNQFLKENFPRPSLEDSSINFLLNLRVFFYAWDNYVRIQIEKSVNLEQLRGLLEKYQKEIEIDSFPVNSSEFSIMMALKEEYKARFYWHSGTYQLRLFSPKRGLPAHLSQAQKKALQTAVLCFRTSLAFYCKDPSIDLLRELANERWTHVSLSLFSLTRCLPSSLLETSSFSSLSSLSSSSSSSFSGLAPSLPLELNDEESEPPTLESSVRAFLTPDYNFRVSPRFSELLSALSKRIQLTGREEIAFGDGSLVCLNAWNLTKLVQLSVLHLQSGNLRTWLETIFPRLPREFQPSGLLPSIPDLENFFLILVLQLYDAAASSSLSPPPSSPSVPSTPATPFFSPSPIPHPGQLWYLAFQTPVWMASENQDRFWRTLLQKYGYRNYALVWTVNHKQMTEEEISRCLTEIRGQKSLPRRSKGLHRFISVFSKTNEISLNFANQEAGTLEKKSYLIFPESFFQVPPESPISPPELEEKFEKPEVSLKVEVYVPSRALGEPSPAPTPSAPNTTAAIPEPSKRRRRHLESLETLNHALEKDQPSFPLQTALRVERQLRKLEEINQKLATVH